MSGRLVTTDAAVQHQFVRRRTGCGLPQFHRGDGLQGGAGFGGGAAIHAGGGEGDGEPGLFQLVAQGGVGLGHVDDQRAVGAPRGDIGDQGQGVAGAGRDDRPDLGAGAAGAPGGEAFEFATRLQNTRPR